MPKPRLHKPVNVTISPIDRSATDMDDDAREAVRGTEFGADIVIKGHVVFRSVADPQFIPQGPSENRRGFVRIRFVDAEAKGYTPRRGDKLKKFGRRTVEYYVQQPEERGHWGDRDGHTLWMLNFIDKRPEKSAPSDL